MGLPLNLDSLAATGQAMAMALSPHYRHMVEEQIAVEEAWQRLAVTVGPKRFAEVKVEAERRLRAHLTAARASAWPAKRAAVIDSVTRDAAEGLL